MVEKEEKEELRSEHRDKKALSREGPELELESEPEPKLELQQKWLRLFT